MLMTRPVMMVKGYIEEVLVKKVLIVAGTFDDWSWRVYSKNLTAA